MNPESDFYTGSNYTMLYSENRLVKIGKCLQLRLPGREDDNPAVNDCHIVRNTDHNCKKRLSRGPWIET